MYFRLIQKSDNRKTGPISVVMASRHTCPETCPFKGKGCYADGGFIRGHWDKLSRGQGGISIKELPGAILALPKGQYLRYADAGDLPGDGKLIHAKEALQLSNSIKKAKIRAFTYTHYLSTEGDIWRRNYRTIRKILSSPGLTINISTEKIEDAERYRELGLPTVVTVQWPKGRKAEEWGDYRVSTTTKGTRVVVCPAVYLESVQCISCGGKNGPLCWRKDRDFIIAFPAHGMRTKMVNEIVGRI